MKDALNLVIVQFAIVIAVAALAGGVFTWAIGRGRRKRALARNEAGHSQAAAPKGASTIQADDADADLKAKMVAPAQPLNHEPGQPLDSEIAPLVSPELSQGVAEPTAMTIPEMPQESIDPAVPDAPVLSQELGGPVAAVPPDSSQQSVGPVSMGIPTGSDVSELSQETFESTDIAPRPESADLGSVPVVPDSGDLVGLQSDTDLAPGAGDLWPSLPAEAIAPVVAPTACGIDEPIVAAVRSEAGDGHFPDQLAGHDLGSEYRKEFDTGMDPNSASVEIEEPSEVIPVVGTDLDALGPDAVDTKSDFDGATHIDPDTVAPYTGGKVAPATWSAPLDMAADVQSEAYPATNAEHMTNTDARVDPATWPSPLDTGSMQPVVLFPTTNVVSESDEARSQDLFLTLAPNQESDDHSDRLSGTDLPEPGQDFGPFAPDTGSEPGAASAETLGATLSASEDSVGATESEVSIEPPSATEGLVLADVSTDESWATGAQPADLDPWNEVHAPEVLAGTEIETPLAEARGETREPGMSSPIETETADIESWNEVREPEAAVAAEPEVDEVDSPAASESGDELGGPVVGLPGVGAPIGLIDSAPAPGAPAAVVAAGAGLAAGAAAAADRCADLDSPSAEAASSEAKDAKVAVDQVETNADVETENSGTISAVMDQAVMDQTKSVDDLTAENTIKGREASEEQTIDELVEAVEIAEAGEPGTEAAPDEADAAPEEVAFEAGPVEANPTEATVARLVTYEQLYDEWGTETIAAVRDPEQSADSDIEHLRAQVVALKEQIVQKDVEMMRLETGATAAWDTTVPSLQQTITELREDNGRLASALREARSNLESMALELDRMQKPRGPLLPPEQSH